MDKIKVLYAPIGDIGVGGLSTIAFKFATNIDYEKINIDYFVIYKIEEEYKNIIKAKKGKVFEVNIKEKRNVIQRKISIIKKFKKVLEENKYNIIHLHIDNSYNALLYGFIAKIFNNSKIIFHAHNSSISGKFKNILHTICKPILYLIGDEYITCSKIASNWMFSKNILKKKNIKFIENGIDIDKYLFNEKIRLEYRKKFNIENNFVIGHVGRFETQKNHQFLLKVFNEVYKKNENSKLILVGTGSLQNKIKDEVNKLELNNNVIFLEKRDDINNLLQAFDLFLFPSLYEGLGIVLIEAQASGLNCIISDVIPEEVDISKYITRLNLQKDNYEKWTNEILSFNKNYNRRKYQEKIIQSDFNIKKSASKLQQFYLDIIE